MRDERKTKAQLIEELSALRERIADLEASEADLRQADRRIRESERQFRRLVESAWEVVVLIDENGGIVYASDAVTRVMGYPVDEHVGSSIFDLIHEADLQRVSDACEEIRRQDGCTATIELRGLHKDGSWRWLEAVATNLLNDPSVEAVVANYRDVTERRKAADALHESEARLRTVISSAPIILWALDRHGVFTLSEGSGLGALGLSPGELVGQSVFEVYKDSPDIIEFNQRALNGESFSATVEVEELAWDVRYVPVFGDGSTVEGVIGVATDITVHRRVEEALSIERAYLDQLFQSSPEAVVLLDNENRILRPNREFKELFGYDAEEVLGMSVDELLAPEGLRNEAVAITKRVAAGDRIAVETVRRRKDGTLVDVSILGAPITTSDGQVAIYGIYRDISERQRAEEALRQSEANYRGLVENATHGIYRSSLEGRFLMVNPALVKMLGYEGEDDLLRVNIGEDVYVRPADRLKAVEKYRRAGRIDGFEVQWKRKDQSPITVWLSGHPVHDDAGGVRYFEMIAEDVTEQRMLEARLRQVQKMEAIGQLTGGIAHDFNNLLTVISANAEIVADSLPSALSSLKQDVQDLQTAAQRGTALVKKLLGFGRRTMLDLQPVNLSKAVSDAAGMVRRILPENIEIHLEVDRPVGNVQADPVAVEQIILNLATNARDAMPDGGILRVQVAEERLDETYSARHPGCYPGQYVGITVADTGFGMTTDTKEHIFEPFFTKKAPGMGTGLGMSMVYGLVKQLNGYVDVASAPDSGTTVRIYFPVLDATAAVEEARAEAVPSLGGNETILVVEDEEAIRRTIKRALEGQGYEVILAGDGEEALEVVRTQETGIHLIISDLIMPKLGGRQLFEALEREGMQVPFLFTSGYSAREVQTSEDVSDDVPLLLKPWTLIDLFTRVREVLDR
jgi:two-component system cell cycle sensor histidine kinase/response regulator CckA